MIPHDWAMSFGKFRGLPTVLAFFKKINFQGREKWKFQGLGPNYFGEVPHTIGYKITLGTVC